MKQTCLLILLCVLSATGFAQTVGQPAETTNLNELVKLELGSHGAGVGYEYPLSSRLLLDVGAGIGMGYGILHNRFQASWLLHDPVAYLKSDVRYMYNRRKRMAKGKSVINNAGNYIGYQAKFTTARLFNNSSSWEQVSHPMNKVLLNEVHWGMQRPLGESFLFNLHLGLGYAHDFDFGHGSLYPAVGVRFNYILLKKER